MISQAGIIIADEGNTRVINGMPVYDAIRAAIDLRERQIIAELEKVCASYRPKTADDRLSMVAIDAINVALNIVKGKNV